MAFFNRYRTDLDTVKCAFYEHRCGFCNPKDYYVTKDECVMYLQQLKDAQKLNKTWNEERKRRKGKILYWSICTFCLILLLTVPVGLFLWLDNQDSTWGIPLCIFASWGVIGLFAWLINVTDQYLNNLNMIYKMNLFPLVNENIEKLFEDYLLKQFINENLSIDNNKDGNQS